MNPLRDQTAIAGVGASPQGKFPEETPVTLAVEAFKRALNDHQNSRFIVEPLHLLDCCLISAGAVKVGDRLEVVFDPVTDDVTIPRFRLSVK